MSDQRKVHYAIEYRDDGGWAEWYSSPDQQDAERVWRRIQQAEPQVPVRFVEVEVLRTGDDAKSAT